MQNTSTIRQPGLLASDFNGEGIPTKWVPIIYSDKDIGKKYEIVERKRNGVHRLRETWQTPWDIKVIGDADSV